MSYRFSISDEVLWTYWHVIGGNGHWVTKRGMYLGMVKRRTDGPELARLRFYGNKTVSRIPPCELTLVPLREKK